MSCSTRTAPCGAVRRDRRRARHDRPRGVARRRQLQRLGHAARERGRDELGDRRMPDRLDVVTAERQLVEPQHAARGVVGELQPALRIDDDDAFDHAGEDRLHLRAIARQLRRAAARAPAPSRRAPARRCPARRRRSRARGGVRSPARYRCATSAMRVHAASDPPRDHPGDQRRRRPARAPSASSVSVDDRLQLLRGSSVSGSARRTNAIAGCLHRHGDVQHVDVQRVAVPARPPDAREPRASTTSGRVRVVLHRRDASSGLRRIADHAAVRRDQGDARVEEPAHAVGLVVEDRRRARRAATTALRASSSAASLASATSVCSIRASVRRRIDWAKSSAGDGQRDDRRRQRGEEELGPKARPWPSQSPVTGGRLQRRRIDQLVAELLDRDERVGEQRQLLAQPPHVDVDGPRAAGVAIAPDVGQQDVARQHAAAVPQQVLEQQELLRGQRRPRCPPDETVCVSGSTTIEP